MFPLTTDQCGQCKSDPLLAWYINHKTKHDTHNTMYITHYTSMHKEHTNMQNQIYIIHSTQEPQPKNKGFFK